MKRYGNLWEQVFSLENIELAHQKAKRGKAHYKEVQMVDRDPDRYLTAIQQMLVEKTYRSSSY